jgi:hypothetical protein
VCVCVCVCVCVPTYAFSRGGPEKVLPNVDVHQSDDVLAKQSSRKAFAIATSVALLLLNSATLQGVCVCVGGLVNE